MAKPTVGFYSEPNENPPLPVSSTGYLLVALTETKDNALNPEGLKALVGKYAAAGLALAVWDHKDQLWVKLTKEMLQG